MILNSRSRIPPSNELVESKFHRQETGASGGPQRQPQLVANQKIPTPKAATAAVPIKPR